MSCSSLRCSFVALNAINNQIRIPHSQQPVAITHPNVVLVQHYLALSPRLDEVFHVWKSAVEVRCREHDCLQRDLLLHAMIHSAKMTTL